MKKYIILLLVFIIITVSSCRQDGNNVTPTLLPGTTVKPDTGGQLIVKPVRGGTMTCGVSSYDNLHPLISNNEDIKYYMTLIYDSMFHLDFELNYAPELAESAETTDGGTTWSIKLRKDVKWHSGEDFKAQDCVDTIKYIQTNGGLYALNVKNIKDCIAPDDFTVEVVLQTPDLYLPCKLTFPVIPSGKNIYTEPDGTSVYRFENDEENKITLAINENYWGEKPYIEKIEIIKFKTERLKFESDVDLLLLTGESVSGYSSKAGYKTYKYSGRSYTCIVPNLYSTFKDINIRKALLYCIDNYSVINSAVSGNGIHADWPLVQGTQYYKDATMSHTRDLVKAGEYLTAAGYYRDGMSYWYKNNDIEKKNPLSFTCIVLSGNMEMRKAAEAVKKQAEELGIVFTVMYLSESQFGTAIKNKTFTLATIQMNIGSWPDMSSLFTKTGNMNFYGYSNTQLDNLMDNLFTSEKVSDTMMNIKEILDNDIPLFGLYVSSEAIALSERIHGRTGNVYFWDPFADLSKWHIFTEGYIENKQ